MTERPARDRGAARRIRRQAARAGAARGAGEAGGGAEAVAGPEAAPPEDRTRAFLEKAAYVVAPGSVIVGLLYYIGRTYTTSYYVHFGIPTTDLELSRESYLAVVPTALFLPLWVLLWCVLVVLAVFGLVLHWLARPREKPLWQLAAVTCALAGGLLLLLGFPVFTEPSWWTRGVLSLLEAGWPRVVIPPLVVALGAALALFALRLHRIGRRERGAPPVGLRIQRLAGAVLIGLLTMSLFFSLARYADEAGDDQAALDAEAGFGGRVRVLINSRSPITHDAHGIEAKDLGDTGGPYRYQYRGFILLAKSSARYYLVSHERLWPKDVTVALPDNEDIRIETLG
ncbi:hypothetical protein ACFWP2_36330 [Kitasatospora sp. NPDC058444]|uniref:hypothetical protein n=1 Tax=Kitasatospora sp. NPDC058444 TaxID=3346504 RepID=UPI0036637A6E